MARAQVTQPVMRLCSGGARFY